MKFCYNINGNGIIGNLIVNTDDLHKYIVVAKENKLIKFTPKVFNYFHRAVNCINENSLVDDLEVITVYEWKQLWNFDMINSYFEINKL